MTRSQRHPAMIIWPPIAIEGAGGEGCGGGIRGATRTSLPVEPQGPVDPRVPVEPRAPVELSVL